eukprot:TRINITY_DN16276_c1_g2_i2.p1 TRINITY_DN16276_c1_g2~~TRINITY_DN16276_c1_g2_i2.p1  ORF type:complete len:244 (-),score=1.79 TRINITY_DN16276_c1_g2_i2:111-842(-)
MQLISDVKYLLNYQQQRATDGQIQSYPQLTLSILEDILDISDGNLYHFRNCTTYTNQASCENDHQYIPSPVPPPPQAQPPTRPQENSAYLNLQRYRPKQNKDKPEEGGDAGFIGGVLGGVMGAGNRQQYNMCYLFGGLEIRRTNNNFWVWSFISFGMCKEMDYDQGIRVKMSSMQLQVIMFLMISAEARNEQLDEQLKYLCTIILSIIDPARLITWYLVTIIHHQCINLIIQKNTTNLYRQCS